MSNTAIDQLFQVVTPTPTGRESSSVAQDDGGLFRSHLDRATEAAASKPPAPKNENETITYEKEDSLENQTEQEETSTTQQDEAAASTENSTPHTEAQESVEETTPPDQNDDEVTLSVAAVEQTEIIVSAEQTPQTEVIVVAAQTTDQQQSGEQQANQNNTAGTENGAAIPASSSNSEQATDILLPTTESGTNSTPSTTEVEAEVAANAEADKAGRLEETQAAVSAATNEEVRKNQTPTKALASQQSASPGPEPNSVSAALAGTNAESSEQETHSRSSPIEPNVTRTENSDQPASKLQGELASSELTNAAPHSSTEANANQPNATPTTAASETPGIVGRSIGNVISSQNSTSTDSASAAQSSETPTVDRAKFVQRVSGAIRSAQQRDGRIQLRLSPPELGTLRIQLTVSEGAITAQLETETAAARTALLDNLPALRERLAEQEIRIEKFDVNVGREGQQQADNREANERQPNNSRSPANPTANQSPAPSQVIEETNRTPTGSSLDTGLDVRI